MAAVVRVGAGHAAHSLVSWGQPRALTMPRSNFGGMQWAHPSAVAFVDGAWVERIQHRVG